jgi:hypothetical protein
MQLKGNRVHLLNFGAPLVTCHGHLPNNMHLYSQTTRDDQPQTQRSTGSGNAKLSHCATCQLQYQTNASLNHDTKYHTYDSTSPLVPFTITTIIRTGKSRGYCYICFQEGLELCMKYDLFPYYLYYLFVDANPHAARLPPS